MREAPAIVVIEGLLAAGAAVRAYDPAATPRGAEASSASASPCCEHSYDALDGADALILVTEWNEFRHPDFERMKKLLKRPLVIDGRNIYDPARMKQLGFEYHSIGRVLRPQSRPIPPFPSRRRLDPDTAPGAGLPRAAALCYLCGMKTALRGTADELLGALAGAAAARLRDRRRGRHRLVQRERRPGSWGSTPAAVVGRNIREFLAPDPAAARRGLFGATCSRGDGSSFPPAVGVVPVARRTPALRLVVVRDAPQRRRAAPGDAGPAAGGEDAERVAHLEIINELSGIINSSLSIGTIFRMVVKELRKLIDYSRASLLLYREKQDDLLIFALDTEMRTVMNKGVRAPMEGTSAGWVVRNNKPWISHDLEQTPFPLDRKLLREGIRSTISIPLSHDRMLGVFNFDSTVPGPLLRAGPGAAAAGGQAHRDRAGERDPLRGDLAREEGVGAHLRRDHRHGLDRGRQAPDRPRQPHAAARRRASPRPRSRAGTAASCSSASGSRAARCLCDETRAGRRPAFAGVQERGRQHLPVLGLPADRRGGEALRDRALPQGRDGAEAAWSSS